MVEQAIVYQSITNSQTFVDRVFASRERIDAYRKQGQGK
jgi:hypothetical protein